MGLTDKILIIVNPKSNEGRTKPKFKKIVSWLDFYKVNLEIMHSNSIEETIDKASKDIESTVIVGAGGDGNQNAIMQGIMRNPYEKVLGVIPEGIANDYSKVFDPFKTKKRLYNSLKDKKTTEVNVGKINDNYFLLYAGIGLDSAILEERNKGHTMGKLSYVRSALTTFSKFKPIRLEIKFGAENICEEISLAEFINFGPYADGLKICPEANPYDGKIDLCLIKGKPNLTTLFYDFLLARKGEHINRSEVSCYQSPRFEIFSSISVEHQFDGERSHKKESHFTIGIAEKKLKVLV